MPEKRPLYVYYQEPVDETWVTVGTYKHDPDSKSGSFTYLEDFTESALSTGIDPFNLPIRPGKPTPFLAKRYGGLHDVLRDSGPDGWGCYLLSKFGGLSQNAVSLDFLKKSGNDDRWGALAIGNAAKAPSTMLEVPTLPGFDLLVEELAAMEEGKPAVDLKLRKRLQEYSGGGARPKATVKDKEGVLWIAKPRSRYDHLETPVLEYFTHAWAALTGIKVAQTNLESTPKGNKLALVKRFDRQGSKRYLCLSAATVFAYEYPGPAGKGVIPPSYPLLASKLKLAGSPVEDRKELFDRMVFNALCGNDDDHTRNHALFFDYQSKTWRLSPAYDMVPNLDGEVNYLAMCTSIQDKRISRKNMLAGFTHFGFESEKEAGLRIDCMVQKARECFSEPAAVLTKDVRNSVQRHFDKTSRLLDGIG